MEKYNIDTEKCDCTVIHDEIVKSVREKMPDDGILLDIADVFKVFCDSTIVKILCALMKSEMCVCDISVLLGMTKSAVSHQLRTLRQANLVKYRKQGKVVYYSVADEHVGLIFDNGFAHVTE